MSINVRNQATTSVDAGVGVLDFTAYQPSVTLTPTSTTVDVALGSLTLGSENPAIQEGATGYDPNEYSSYTQRYVDLDSGSDSNSGTSYADGWLTLQHAHDNVTPGTVINLRGTPGQTYDQGNNPAYGGPRFAINPGVSGTSGNYIVVQPEAGFERAFTITGGDAIYYMDNSTKDYFVFRGLKMASNVTSTSDECCFSINSNSSHYIFEWCDLGGNTLPGGGNDNHQAIYVWGGNHDDFTIRHCKLHGSNSGSFQRSATFRPYGIDGLEFHNNECYDSGFAIDLKGGGSNFNIYKNIFRDCTDGGISTVHTSSSSRITNVDIYQNVIFDCSGQYVIYSDNGQYTDLRFFNNSIHNLDRGHYSDRTQTSIGLEKFNNVYDLTSNFIYRGFTMSQSYILNTAVDYWDYNLYTQSNTNGQTAMSQATWDANYDANSLISTAAGYVDQAAEDFRLNDSANGIGSGTSAAIGAGIDRAQLLGGSASAAINMGAYITTDQTDDIGPDW